MIGTGTSLFLIAVGAILRFAVTVTTRGIDIHTIGVILMIVGGIGLLLSLLWLTLWTDRTRRYERDAAVPPHGQYYDPAPRP